MATVRDLINDALMEIGVLADGETATASMETSALRSLNRMIGEWSNESLMIYTKAREEFALVSGQSSYTMGTGGNFNSSRPMKIELAAVSVAGADPFESPIEILNQDEWAMITVKTTQSTFPTKLYASGTYPLETIKLWPVPTEANNLVLYSWKPLSAFATLSEIVSLPPGYESAIIYNGAVRLAPSYNKEASATLMVLADESITKIKRMNIKPQYLSCDPAVLSRGGSFNILTGE